MRQREPREKVGGQRSITSGISFSAPLRAPFPASDPGCFSSVSLPRSPDSEREGHYLRLGLSLSSTLYYEYNIISCVTMKKLTPRGILLFITWQVFYPGRYHKDYGSIFPMGDLTLMIPPEEADICILEEPEHLNW